MPTVAIHKHPLPSPADFETSDTATVEALRKTYPHNETIVPVRDLAIQLRIVGRNLWSNVLDGLEEAHCVTVRFT
jgi:hypothetical protein